MGSAGINNPSEASVANGSKFAPWYAAIIVVWSAFIMMSVTGWGRVSVDGTVVSSQFQVMWGTFAISLAALCVAVAILVVWRRGDYRRVGVLFVVTAILGIVGIIGAVVSVIALVHIRVRAHQGGGRRGG